jgi:hypothetical protein
MHPDFENGSFPIRNDWCEFGQSDSNHRAIKLMKIRHNPGLTSLLGSDPEMNCSAAARANKARVLPAGFGADMRYQTAKIWHPGSHLIPCS